MYTVESKYLNSAVFGTASFSILMFRTTLSSPVTGNRFSSCSPSSLCHPTTSVTFSTSYPLSSFYHVVREHHVPWRFEFPSHIFCQTSMTITNKKGLSAEPWCTPIITLKDPLNPSVCKTVKLNISVHISPSNKSVHKCY